MKKIHIKTYGCQMNAYDSTRMGEIMAPLGYGTTDSVEDSDMVVLNTCHIREKAADKIFSDLGRLKWLKHGREKDGGRMLIAVAGCVAQAEGDEIRRRAPYVDIIVGPQTYQNLPQLVEKAMNSNKTQVMLDFDAEDKFSRLGKAEVSRGTQAFLTIQEGCDKFCTFCVVPYTRGAEISRSAADIYAEARKLAAAGAVEITLLGQNVNGYHGIGTDGAEWNLARLVKYLAEIPEIKRIRYTTSHPKDMDMDLIMAHGEVEKLMPFMHLPVQSGSDRILRKMNRRHTAEEYLDIISRMRAVRPDIAFSSDFIVGFPGESDEDFEATIKLIEDVGFAQSYSFKYSMRPGTPAAEDENQVAEEVKSERLARLQALLDQQLRDFNAGCIGMQMPVLLEKQGRNKGQMAGRSPYMQSVHIDDCTLPVGTFVDVKISECLPHGLKGEIMQSA